MTGIATATPGIDDEGGDIRQHSYGVFLQHPAEPGGGSLVRLAKTPDDAPDFPRFLWCRPNGATAHSHRAPEPGSDAFMSGGSGYEADSATGSSPK